MSITQWDPWKELDELRSLTDNLWNTFFAKLSDMSEAPQSVGFLPDVDIVETAHDIRIYMSVPGVVEDDLEIDASPTTLTVRGERHPPYDLDREHVREWRYGFFERQLSFAKPVDVERVKANYDAGVLTIVIPRTEEASNDE